MKTAGLFKLNLKDLGKGLLMAFLSALVTSITQAISNGGLPTLEQLKAAALIGASAAVAYLLKNLLTNNEDQFLKKDN
jgi:hypothetical protein